MKKDARFAELLQWLQKSGGLQSPSIEPASSDASFRRYFRVAGRPDEPAMIAMDAPPPREDCRPFVTVAAYLEAMSLNVPHVIAADLDRGFLLLSDLGNCPFLNALENDSSQADHLYAEAIDALVGMQVRGADFQDRLPPYDETLLRSELALFHDWLCNTHLDLRFSSADEAAWQRCCDTLVDNALSQEQVFVHRDYHSRNLMVTPENNPGILDFQDAVQGPCTYDLVSLLKDCYIKSPATVIDERAGYFLERLASESARVIDKQCFRREFDLMGVQRHLKAAGIFARLLHRDGKEGYLRDVPRTLSYIGDIVPRYDELQFLGRLIEERILPGLGDQR